MKLINLRLSLTGTLLVLVVGCQNNPSSGRKSASKSGNSQEQIFQVNKLMIKNDASAIRAKAEKMGWVLQETNTGLFYQVLSSRSPRQLESTPINTGDEVQLTYSVSLLDGRHCYSSKESGLKVFRVETSEAEQGLHEAVKLLHEGDSARIIIPPYLGFGLTGDGNRIPGRAVMIYLIRVVSVIPTRNP